MQMFKYSTTVYQKQDSFKSMLLLTNIPVIPVILLETSLFLCTNITLLKTRNRVSPKCHQVQGLTNELNDIITVESIFLQSQLTVYIIIQNKKT